MIRYKNEIFLNNHEIDELVSENGLSSKDICSSLIEFYYLKGSIFCIYENVFCKTVQTIIDSLFKQNYQNIDYYKGIYNLNMKSKSWEYFIDGFITNFSYGDTRSNRYIIAFQPTDYCSIKGLEYVHYKDNFLILNDSKEFINKLQSEFNIAKTNQRLSIHKKNEILKKALPSDNEEITLLEEISSDAKLWYNKRHYNRCLVDQFVKRDSSNKGFTSFYKLSDVKNKLNELIPGILIKRKLLSIDELITFLKKNITDNKNILVSMLNKFKEDTNLMLTPSFNELQDHTVNIVTILPLIQETGIKELKTFNNRIVKFENLESTYYRQLDSLSKKLEAT